MIADQIDLRNECDILCRYLLKEKPTELMYELYLKANHQLKLAPSNREKMIWRKCMSNQSFLYQMDAALPASSYIRKKVHTCLAIAESIPEYSNYFLHSDHGGGFFTIVLTGTKALLIRQLGKIKLMFM